MMCSWLVLFVGLLLPLATLLMETWWHIQGKRIKLGSPLRYPMSLDLSPFLGSEGARPGEVVSYELAGVVVHLGGAYGGHYVSYLRDVLGEGNWEDPSKKGRSRVGGSKWFRFDDRAVHPAWEEDVLAFIGGSSDSACEWLVPFIDHREFLTSSRCAWKICWCTEKQESAKFLRLPAYLDTFWLMWMALRGRWRQNARYMRTK